MNDYDGQRIIDILNNAEYTQVNNTKEADILVYYTCNIREKAVHKLMSAIGMDKTDQTKVIAVGGCIAQAEGKKIFSKIPGINISFGPQTYHKLPDYINDIITKKRKRIIDQQFYKLDKFDNTPNRHTVNISEYVAIQEGCDNFCTYCVVPYTRGREYSRPVIDIINEVKLLISRGAKEIVLGGQNVNSYHGEAPYITIGQPKATWRIERLIQEISEINGLKRLRYITANPRDFTTELMRIHTEIPILVPFTHMPLQSGSDKILKLMNRNHTAQEYLDKLKMFRDICPNIQFSSDFIVGFPNETEEDFEDTLRVAEQAKYTISFSFKYSIRENTPAAKMPNQVPEKIKEERLERLHQVLLKDQKYFNQQLVGETQEILFYKHGKRENQYIGKNVYMQSVVVHSNDNLIGKFANVKIDSAEDNCVFGTIVND